MKRFIAAALLASASLVVPSQLVAQDAIDRRLAERVGLNPAQARALFARISGQQSQIAALAQANPNLSPEQLLNAIRALATDAAQAQTRIAALTDAIAALDPGGERSRASTLLVHARIAFDEGRLEDAETAFAQLSFLRSSELAQARNAWLAAMDLQAQSASLRGDTEGATQIRLAKMVEIRAQRAAAESDELATAQVIADDWYRRGDRLGDNAALLRSIGYFRELVLPLAPRDRVPLDWAASQHNLGTALQTLGARESGTARLEEAVAAFRLALEETTRDRAPFAWARTQNNLGNAFFTLGAREAGTAGLEAATAAYRMALEERTRVRVPLDWAITQTNLGNALQLLGNRETGATRLQEAVVAYRLALEEVTRSRAPLNWATTQNNLGIVLHALSGRETGTARLEEAVIAHRLALEERTRDRAPLDWAASQHNLGYTLAFLGVREGSMARLNEAVVALNLALEERTRERVPLDWAATRLSLALVMGALAEGMGDTDQLTEAEGMAMEARSVAVSGGHQALVEWADLILAGTARVRARGN
jgi:tetratricopeptide (TPR) repeat protein